MNIIGFSLLGFGFDLDIAKPAEPLFFVEKFVMTYGFSLFMGPIELVIYLPFNRRRK